MRPNFASVLVFVCIINEEGRGTVKEILLSINFAACACIAVDLVSTLLAFGG
jgi:hypothetical protein